MVSDRFNRKRVMVGCELMQGALVAAPAFWLPSLPLLQLLMGFSPAGRAGVSARVAGRRPQPLCEIATLCGNSGRTEEKCPRRPIHRGKQPYLRGSGWAGEEARTS
jgi:hypothetical protein